MLGTTTAYIIMIAEIMLAGVFGVAAGLVTCALLPRPWGLRAIGIDATFAMLVAIVVGYVVAERDMARGVWESNLWPVWTVAALSVVPLHMFRPKSR